jgi:hypothetical protein
VYGWQPSDDWVSDNVQNHGPLGGVYPDKMWVYEGDTPSFLHLIPNGLHNPDEPAQGGWGGRFGPEKTGGVEGMSGHSRGDCSCGPAIYTDAGSDASINRWQGALENDFAARMDWSVKGNYSEANHHPIAILNGDRGKSVLEMSASPGSSVVLSAEGSSDPDSDSLSFKWWYYDEPSSYSGSVSISGDNSENATVEVPSGAGGKNLHIILEIADNGSPALTVYRRMIINVD